MSLFNYTSSLKEIFDRKGAYLPGQSTKNNPKLASANLTRDTDSAIEFGQVVKRVIMADGTPYITAIEAGDTASDFYGIAMRDVVSQYQFTVNAQGSYFVSTYRPGQLVSALTWGYIAVPVQKGTPQVGGKVYMRIAASLSNPSLPIGGIEAEPTTDETVELTRCHFESNSYFPMNGVSSVPSSTTPTSQVATIFVESGNGAVSTDSEYFYIGAKLADYTKTQAGNEDKVTIAKSGNNIKLSCDLSALTAVISTDPAQAALGAKKWVGIIIDTGETDAATVAYNNVQLTSADVSEAAIVGGNGTSEFVLYIRAEDVSIEPKVFALSKSGKQTAVYTVSVNA